MCKYVVFEGKKTVEIDKKCIDEYEKKVGKFTQNTVNYLVATLGLSEEQTESVLSEEIMKAMKEDCEDSAMVKELLKNHITFHEFNHFLSEEIKEQYPDAELLMIKGGDFIQDIEMEVRCNKRNICYKPFEMYQAGCISNDFESVIYTFVGKIGESENAH